MGGVSVEGGYRPGVEAVGGMRVVGGLWFENGGMVGVELIYLVKGGRVWVYGCLEGVCCQVSGVYGGEIGYVCWVLRGVGGVVGCPEARWFLS